jgi:hypothetical protein
MNAKQWNAAMFSALLALSVIAVPFFAIAQDFDFGGVSDADFGGFSDNDFGGFSDTDFGGFSDADFGGFSSADFGGAGGAGTPVYGNNDGTGVTNTDPGFDPFDGDMGPFDDVPGTPPGDDEMPNPDPDDDGCIVNCGGDDDDDDDGGSSNGGSRDVIRIFIDQLFIREAFERLPGDQVPLRIKFENDGNKDMDNTKVIVMIPDLNVRDSVGPFDLDAGEEVSKTMLLALPGDVEPGMYPVRLYIHNLRTHRIVHRDIEVIDY